MLARRTQLHQNFLVEHITPFSSRFQDREHLLRELLRDRDPLLAFGNNPLIVMYQEVLRQARLLAYNDAFWLLSLLTAFLIPPVLLLKSSQTGEKPTPAAA